MKKLFFCALAAIVSLQVASAQKRGEMYVGGSLGVSPTIGFKYYF